MNKRAVVSFANKNGRYVKGLSRLSESLRDNFTGDFLGFIHEKSLGCPLHTDSNYAFKIFATRKAIEQDYTSILWLDASCFAVGQIDCLFDEIEEKHFIFQDSGHFLGEWCNDRTLKYFKIDRDEAMEIRLIGNAGFLGFDFSSTIGTEFFRMYYESQKDGMFNGSWTNDNQSESKDERVKGHRHDITCATACLYKLGVLDLMKPGDEILQYAGPYDANRNETILIKAQGL